MKIITAEIKFSKMGKHLVIITTIVSCLSLASSSLIAQKKAEKPMNEMWGTKVNKQNAHPDDNAAWFADAKYAMFIHWSLFSQNENRWQGKTYYGIGEWLMYLAKTNIGDYEKTANDFNPVKFNAREWVQLAKDAGLGRESLYKALTPGAKPRYDTMIKVINALGVQLQVVPVAAAT